MSPEPAAQPRGHAWHLVLGLALWFAWFSVTYGGVAVACAVAPPAPAAGPLNWINAAVLLLALVSASAFGVGAWRSARAARQAPSGAAGTRQRFISRAASMLYAIAALATVVVVWPAAWLAACA